MFRLKTPESCVSGSILLLSLILSFNSFTELKSSNNSIDPILLYTAPQKQDGPAQQPIYLLVDSMPKFPGGEEALLRFINQNIHYPKEAIKNKTHGKVVVVFIISETGAIKDAKVIRKVSPEIDEEALRVINSLPAWIPGKQKGKAINVQYTLPVNFRLKAPEKADMQKAAFILNGRLMPADFDKSSIDPKSIKSVDVIKPDSNSKTSGITDKYREFAKNGVIIMQTNQPEKDSLRQKEDNKIYTMVEQMPVFPGGERELLNFINRKLKYPSEAVRNREQGKVILRFVINKTGKVENVKVIHGVSVLLDEEAIRVVKSIPDFIPGKQNGENVNVYFTLPIAFNLN